MIISLNAAKRIEALIQQQKEAAFLRVTVEGGGCSGFKYTFTLDQTSQEGDTHFTQDGIHVVVDATSLALLEGCTLDYVETLAQSTFMIQNPNAASKCGCGSSFSL
jgi:iron-sulfur cluster assembly accessory protein